MTLCFIKTFTALFNLTSPKEIQTANLHLITNSYKQHTLSVKTSTLSFLFFCGSHVCTDLQVRLTFFIS